MAFLTVAALGHANDSGDYALKGILVTPTEVVKGGTIVIVGDKIQAIGKGVRIPNGVKIVETRAFIYPGLIDLHNHITWNFLPRWKPGHKFANRYEWQQFPDYLSNVKTPHDQIVPYATPPSTRSAAQEDLACDANRYGEVKAIVGGATSIVDSLGTAKDDPCIKGLARNLNSYSALYRNGEPEKLQNAVFPLELSNDDVKKIDGDLNDLQHSHALVVHLAEGKPNDASSAREFRMFKARGFLRDGVSIIHGVALRQPEFAEMASNCVGLIWSPRSNIELYGDTTDVRAAKQSGVEIALAPDWSPTGSDGMLEELKYAAEWNARQNPQVFTDAELVFMVTVHAAELAKLEDSIGSLQPNHFADLLVVRSEDTDPYRALVKASPADVRLVIVGGSPVYGDEDLMKTLAPSAQLEQVLVCGTRKLFNFETEELLQGKPPKSWKDTVDALRTALQPWGLAPSALSPCPSQVDSNPATLKPRNLPRTSVPTMNGCGFSLCHLIDGLLLGIITGIISGLYTAFVSERIQRFYQIRNEALRRVRTVEFGFDDQQFKANRTNRQLADAQNEFVLLAAELYSLGHEQAGNAINKLFDELSEVRSAAAIPPDFDETYARWQRQLRELPPTRWRYYRPW